MDPARRTRNRPPSATRAIVGSVGALVALCVMATITVGNAHDDSDMCTRDGSVGGGNTLRSSTSRDSGYLLRYRGGAPTRDITGTGAKASGVAGTISSCGARAFAYATALLCDAVWLGPRGGREEAGRVAWPRGCVGQKGIGQSRGAATDAPGEPAPHHGGWGQGVGGNAADPEGKARHAPTLATADAGHYHRGCYREEGGARRNAPVDITSITEGYERTITRIVGEEDYHRRSRGNRGRRMEPCGDGIIRASRYRRRQLVRTAASADARGGKGGRDDTTAARHVDDDRTPANGGSRRGSIGDPGCDYDGCWSGCRCSGGGFDGCPNADADDDGGDHSSSGDRDKCHDCPPDVAMVDGVSLGDDDEGGQDGGAGNGAWGLVMDEIGRTDRNDHGESNRLEADEEGNEGDDDRDEGGSDSGRRPICVISSRALLVLPGDATRRTRMTKEESRGLDTTLKRSTGGQSHAYICSHFIPCQRRLTSPLHPPSTTRWEVALPISTKQRAQPSSSTWEAAPPCLTKPLDQPSPTTWAASAWEEAVDWDQGFNGVIVHGVEVGPGGEVRCGMTWSLTAPPKCRCETGMAIGEAEDLRRREAALSLCEVSTCRIVLPGQERGGSCRTTVSRHAWRGCCRSKRALVPDLGLLETGGAEAAPPLGPAGSYTSSTNLTSLGRGCGGRRRGGVPKGGTWRRRTEKTTLTMLEFTPTTACTPPEVALPALTPRHLHDGPDDGVGAAAAHGATAVKYDESLVLVQIVAIFVSHLALLVAAQALADMTGTLSCAAAAARRHLTNDWDGASDGDAPTCSGGALKIGRTRIRRRARRKVRSQDRARATCRRAEAWVLAYLIMSSHVLSCRARNGKWHRDGNKDDWAATLDAARAPWCGRQLHVDHWQGADRGHRASRPLPGGIPADVSEVAEPRVGNSSGARWWSDVGRIGEAANPGPTAATMIVYGMLRRTYATARSAISYPNPGTRTLRGAIAPGYSTAHDDQGGEQLFALSIETSNTTGWRGLQRRLTTSAAHAILAQETWVTQDAIPAASAWAMRRGWKSVWTAAVPGPNGGASGGAAIFVRSQMGLRYPPDGSHEWCPGRAVAGIIDAPGHRPLLLVSCYLVHGIGPAQANLDLLAAIGRRKQAMGGEFELLIGGDMNMEPPDFAMTGFETQINATMLTPSTCRGTYRAARAASLLDYFVVTNRAAAAVQSVRVVEESAAKGHKPVVLTFKPYATTLRALHLRRPPALGTTRVHGPVAAPPSWSAAAEKAEVALGAAKRGDANTQDQLDEVYRLWANLAEEEISNYTGQTLKKYGERGRMPNFVWRSVMPEQAPAEGKPTAAAAAWLGGVIKELTRCCNAVIAQHGGQNDDAEDFDDDPVMTSDGTHDEGRVEMEIRAARARRPPTTGKGCAKVVREILGSMERDFPTCIGGEAHEELDEVHAKVVESATNLHDAIFCDIDVTNSTGRDRRDATIREVLVELARLADDAAEVEARTTAKENAEANRRWKEWVSDGVEKGAARAHAYVRGPKAWTPTAVKLPDGSESGALDDLIADQRAKYSRLWKPAQRAFHYLWDDRDAMPRMTPAQMREAAKSFKEATATTFDGFHPRGLECLSDDALATLATMLEAVESSGIWPRQLSMVVAALLPKPAGGYRPIGLAPAVYRLWAKVRKADADAWEKRYPRPYFSQCRGSGPVDAMWRLAARQEAGAAEGEVAATASEDLQSFFETLDRERLASEAKALGFPLPVLRAALAAYSSARVVTLGGRISREVYPTTGVVAGCSLAMALTKVYCLRAFDDFVAEAPKRVQLGTFVDDLTLAAIGAPAAVVEDLTRAHAILTDIVNGTLGCAFAVGKTTLTATTRSVAATIARRLKIPGGTTAAATLLGTDNTSAAPRAVLRSGSKKSARLKAAMAKRKRLRQIQKAIGTRARKIFVAGVQPAATYGAQLWGLDDGEVTRLRQVAAAALRPQARGRSLQATLLWHDLPTAAAELAPLHQLAKATWDAMTAREAAQERGASVADIRRWWQAASEHFTPLVRRYERLATEARQRGVDISRSATRSLWRAVRGPLGAAALTAARIGWKLTDPYCLVDQNGTDFLLTNTSPALVQKLAIEALRATLERNVAAKWAKEELQFEGRRACFDFITAGVKACKELTPHQRGIMRAVSCGAIMTGSRAVKMGYLVSGICPLCGEAPDTMAHRVYGCACTAAAVGAVVPRWFMEEARRAASGDRFWTTGICPNPVDLAPLPAKDLQVVVEKLEDDDAMGGDGGQDDLIAVRGRVYWDGSATTSTVRGLTRAACAIVQTDAAGKPTKVLQAAVPRHLPQTAQSAEFLGLGLVFQALRGPTAVIGDCINVVRAANGTARGALGHRQMYAGITLSTYGQPERRKWAGEILWTRAHRKLRGGEDEDELRDIRGNAAADEAAKGALAGHAAIGVDAESQVRYFERRVPHVIRATIAALQLFPKAPGDMKRAPRPITEDQARQRQRHHWTHRGGAWRCSLCDDWLNGEQVPRARKFQKCRGRTIVDIASEFAARGHVIYRAEADVRFVYCGRCGAWGHKRTHHLSTACSPPRASGIQALRRIRRGEHPLQRRGPRGVLLPRERVRTIARYDALSAKWRQAGQCDQGGARHAEAERRCDVDEHGDDLRVHDDLMNISAEDDVMRLIMEQASDHCGGIDSVGVSQEPGQVMPGDLDEDVFGHGGSLDQPPAAVEMSVEPSASETPAHHGGGDVQRSRRGARSIWERTADGSAAAAIERMKRGSRPPSTDAAGRLRAVKRRVMEKLARGEETGDQPFRVPAAADENGPPVRTSDGSGDRSIGAYAEGDEVLDEGVLAKSARSSVGVTCEGPGAPSPCSETDTITRPTLGASVVETVAAGDEAASCKTGNHAREDSSDRGKAAFGPPRGAAAPREDTMGTSGGLQGRELALTSQTKPLSASGGRPRYGREEDSPQETPTRLGAGPSNGREEQLQNGGRPATRRRTERRRDGDADSTTRASAARGSGDAAAPSRREMPSKGIHRRTQDARNECSDIQQSGRRRGAETVADYASDGLQERGSKARRKDMAAGPGEETDQPQNAAGSGGNLSRRGGDGGAVSRRSPSDSRVRNGFRHCANQEKEMTDGSATLSTACSTEPVAQRVQDPVRDPGLAHGEHQRETEAVDSRTVPAQRQPSPAHDRGRVGPSRPQWTAGGEDAVGNVRSTNSSPSSADVGRSECLAASDLDSPRVPFSFAVRPLNADESQHRASAAQWRPRRDCGSSAAQPGGEDARQDAESGGDPGPTSGLATCTIDGGERTTTGAVTMHLTEEAEATAVRSGLAGRPVALTVADMGIDSPNLRAQGTSRHFALEEGIAEAATEIVSETCGTKDRTVSGSDERSCKRRRLRGKQPPRGDGGALNVQEVAHSQLDDGRVAVRGSPAPPNSVHVSSRACSSRSGGLTSTWHRVAREHDRDVQAPADRGAAMPAVWSPWCGRPPDA